VFVALSAPHCAHHVPARAHGMEPARRGRVVVAFVRQIVGMNALSAAVYASLLNAKCNRARVRPSALTSQDVIRPIPDAAKFQSRELFRCVRRISAKDRRKSARPDWARALPKVSGSNRMFRQRFGGPGETVFKGGFGRIP